MANMSVDAFSTLGKRTGLEGLVSGIETSDIIKSYTSNTRNKITSQIQKRQQEMWRQEQYQEIIKKMQTFYNKYNSYSSSSNILKSSFFTSSKITSSSSFVTASGDSKAVQNMKIKDIKSLAAQASFTSSHKVSGCTAKTGSLREAWQSNTAAGSTLSFKVDDKDYSVKIASDFTFSEAVFEKDEDGNMTDAAKTAMANELEGAINAAISENSDLNGKLSVSHTEDGVFSITSTDGSKFKLSGGTSKLLSAMGLKTTKTEVDAVVGGKLKTEDFAQKNTLSEALAGTSVNFSYNGVVKTVNFKESEKDQFGTVEDLTSYIQKSLDSTFGRGKVSVSLGDDNALSFTTADASSIFTVSGSTSSGVLGENGALRVNAAESNRTVFSKTLDQLASSFNTPLTADENGKYSLTVNGVDFSFDGNTELNTVINRINASEEAAVTISYSSVSDTFSVRADNYGTAGAVNISDSGTSNLASVLFGAQGTDYTVKEGTDFVASMSFDGGNTYVDVTRETNSFTLDGVTLSFNGKAEGDAEENISFTAEQNVDEIYDRIKEYIDGYNEIVDWLNTKVNETKYGLLASDDYEEYLPLTDEQKEDMTEKEIEKWEEKAKTGLLRNDSSLYNVSLGMRRAMTDLIGDSGLGLYQIGITTSSNWNDGGKLVIDEDKLKEAISTNIDNVQKIFSDSENGVAYRLKSVLESAAVGTSEADGMLVQIAGKPDNSNYQSIMSTRISNMNTRLTTLKRMLQNEEDRWWSKFSALESYISTMNNQSSLFSFGQSS